jgi:hypothetical protein
MQSDSHFELAGRFLTAAARLMPSHPEVFLGTVGRHQKSISFVIRDLAGCIPPCQLFVAEDAPAPRIGALYAGVALRSALI